MSKRVEVVAGSDELGDPHLQRYVGNGPTNASDPDGRRLIGLPSPGVFQLLPAGVTALLPTAGWIAGQADTAISLAGAGTSLAAELWNRDPDQVLDDVTEYATGVGQGFLEGITGWKDLAQLGIDALQLLWRYSLVNTCTRPAQGDTFEPERRAAQLLLRVQRAVGGVMVPEHVASVIRLFGPGWRHGDVRGDLAWSRAPFAQLPLPPGLLQLLTWTVLAWELGSPVLVLMPTTRTAALLLGVAFHVGTGLALQLGPFPLYMLCLYLPLIPWERLTDRRQP